MSDRKREFDLIQDIRAAALEAPDGVLCSIGDDSAVLEIDPRARLVVTTDLLVEGIHFRRDWFHPVVLGRKACHVNLSDLAAMGARPYVGFLTLALPKSLEQVYCDRLVEGLSGAFRDSGVALIGGDCSASGEIHIGVTLMGLVDSGDPVYRSGARVGDRVILVGQLGLARKGWELLSRRSLPIEAIRTPHGIGELEGAEGSLRFLRAYLFPTALVREGVKLRERGATSLIDVSDGLGADLLHVAKASGVDLEIDAQTLETLASEWGCTEEELLNGGEDYALAGTIAPEDWTELLEYWPADLETPRILGRAVQGKGALWRLDRRGREMIHPQGYDHFR